MCLAASQEVTMLVDWLIQVPPEGKSCLVIREATVVAVQVGPKQEWITFEQISTVPTVQKKKMKKKKLQADLNIHIFVLHKIYAV